MILSVFIVNLFFSFHLVVLKLGIARQWPQLADYSVVTGQNINGAYIKALSSSLMFSIFKYIKNCKLKTDTN
jgi:hypothetical protein